MSSALPRRLFALVEALQGGVPRTTAELATKLGVSRRTIRRDLGRLIELEYPVQTQVGRHGGVSLPAGTSLPAVRFTDDELVALVIGLKSAAATGDGVLEGAAARALTRLEAVLTPVVRQRVRALQVAVSQPGADVRNPVPAPSQHVIALAEACSRGERVQISYRGGNHGQVTERRIDPYGLARLGPWYVVAYCHLRNDLRTFRIDRIRSIGATSERFAPPERFDASKHVSEAIAMAPMQGDLVCSAILRIDLQTASRRLALSTLLLQPVDGGVRVTVRTDAGGLDWVLEQLLRLRCPVLIEGPAELRQAAARLVDRLQGF